MTAQIGSTHPFITQIDSAPIYTDMLQSASHVPMNIGNPANSSSKAYSPFPIDPLLQNYYPLGAGPPFQLNQISSSQGVNKTAPQWQKWFQQLENQVNIANYYGNPSVLLNSDFYWNRGIATPVTQADPDGTFVSEKWQVTGNTAANYTITQTPYAANSSDQTGSTTYLHVQINSYNGGTFWIYQAQDGSQFLRRYQGRTINFSTIILNNQQQTITLKLLIRFTYDPSSTTYQQTNLVLQPGVNSVSSAIQTPMIGSTAVGAAPTVTYALSMVSSPDNTADFNLTYLKAEMADTATPLYVDHALEKTRIDNS